MKAQDYSEDGPHFDLEGPGPPQEFRDQRIPHGFEGSTIETQKIPSGDGSSQANSNQELSIANEGKDSTFSPKDLNHMDPDEHIAIQEGFFDDKSEICQIEREASLT